MTDQQGDHSPKRFRSRTSIYDLPGWETRCDLAKPCVYRRDGKCDTPRLNKGNGDSACHKITNRDVLFMLNASEAAALARFKEKIKWR